MAFRNRDNRVVLVTGFGPFQGHPRNASWEAVKELKKLEIESRFNVALVTEEISVTYSTVSSLIPKLWSQHEPMLAVHVGVSAAAKCLTLESRAHKTGYKRPDVESKCPLENFADEELEEEVKTTGVDVKRICDGINGCKQTGNDEGCEAVVSDNAGRYLCEYIFHRSLSLRPERTIFVHVPDEQIYTAKKSAQGLSDVIRYAVEIIDESEGKGSKEEN